MSVLDHGCELAIEGLDIVIGLVEVAGGPVNEVPGERLEARRFGAAGSGDPLRPGRLLSTHRVKCDSHHCKTPGYPTLRTPC